MREIRTSGQARLVHAVKMCYSHDHLWNTIVQALDANKTFVVGASSEAKFS